MIIMVIIMNDIIDKIKERAKKNKKTIVLPETMDFRILEATDIILREGIADIILIGDRADIIKKANGLDLSKATIINPIESKYSTDFVNDLYQLRKDKGMTLEDAKNLVFNDYMYYACMLVRAGYADGVVSGACHSTSNTLRPALQILKTKPGVKLVSAFFLMVVPDCELGYNGTFLFADSGLEQNPDSEKLAAIAISSAESFKLLTEEEPIVAMLSHSTLGSAKHNDVDKVIEATRIAKNNNCEFLIDGELQLDAAIVPDVAKLKAPNSEVAGRANVLVFPDLDAGNIGYKLVERLAKAQAYGPICQGISKPVNDLSRGCSSLDIVGVVAITAVQANSN